MASSRCRGSPNPSRCSGTIGGCRTSAPRRSTISGSHRGSSPPVSACSRWTCCSAPRADVSPRSSPTARSPTTGSRARSASIRTRGDARGRVGRRLPRDPCSVPSGVRGVDGADAGASRRVLPARHGPEPADRRRRGVGCGVRLPGLGALGQLGQGAAADGDRRTSRDRTRSRAPPAAAGRPRPIPAGSLGGSLLDELPRPRGEGSNDWVVAGTRTATGKPLLANDPHLLAVQPGAWIEMHLRAPGYEARGVALTFSPGILLGTTAHHSWGVTNVSGDVQDLYVEHLNDERTAAEHVGAWEPLTVHREQIHVARSRRTGRRRRLTRRDTARSSRPRRWATCTPSTSRWSRRDVRAAVDGLRLRHPSVARPRRRGRDQLRGVPPRGVGRGVPGPELRLRRRGRRDRLSVHRAVPGSRRRRRHHARARMVRRVRVERLDPVRRAALGGRPAHGYLVTANNRIHDDAYPHLIGHDFHTPYRARRVVERLEAIAPSRCRLDGADPARHGLAPRDAAALPVAARPRAPERRGTTSDRADRRLGRRHVRALPGGRRVQRVVAPHRPARVTPAPGGRPVPAATTPTGRPSNARSCRRGSATPPVRSTTSCSMRRSPTRRPNSRERLGPDPSAWTWGALHRLALIHPLGAIPGLGVSSSRRVTPSSAATSRPWHRADSTGATATPST